MKKYQRFNDFINNSTEIRQNRKKYFPAFYLKKNFTKEKSFEYAFKYYSGEITQAEDKLIKNACTFSVDYWLVRGFKYEEAAKIVSDKQRKNANKRKNKPNAVKSYRETSIRCKEYWVKRGYSEDEASKRIKRAQATFSLEKCVSKSGPKAGQKRFEERQLKWQKTLQDRDDYQDIVVRRIKNFAGTSKISQRLFSDIFQRLDPELQEKTYFSDEKGEFAVRTEERVYLFDFVISSIKVCIEFNGDIWHANPQNYNELDTPSPFSDLTSKEIWDNDERKIESINDRGFKTLVVWERDYKENAEDVLLKCLEFIKETR